LTYYIIPLLIGALLYISELWTKVDKNKKYLVSIVSSKFAHYGLIILVFSAGLLLLASQAIPGMVERIHVVNQIL
ncbi:hypothetical protein L0P50_19405, partial [Lawsonibacter sp. DFI.6.74]|nr:hypothetical protein [Lawsonibacter sp. DFI.6.74]